MYCCSRAVKRTRSLTSRGVSAPIVCGHYEFWAELSHPLLCDLPAMIHVRCLDLLPGAQTASALPLLMSEVSNPSAGSTAAIERYAQILLIQVLRAHTSQNPYRTGVLSALRDPRLALAIHRVHWVYSALIGLDDLAKEAALSRSAFAQKFKDTAGIAPIEYQAKWWMLLAADLLQGTDHSILQISENVGYESDISFARAFKREFGVTPSHFRNTAS
jgi:AraC-like DNA-binding protein